MSHRSSLVAAASLLGAAIASVAHAGGNAPLALTTVSSLNVSMVSGVPTLQFSYSYSTGTPSTYKSTSTYSSPATPSGEIRWWSSAGEDQLKVRYVTGQEPGLLPPGIFSGSIIWNVTFTGWSSLSTMTSALAGAWTSNDGSGPSSMTLGQTFGPGSYTFEWALSSPTLVASDGSHYDFDLGFTAAAAPVPLPGAAVLAAIGLVAGPRRRRR